MINLENPVPIKENDPMVIPDPHVVYYDAVLNSPWNQQGQQKLPGRYDWSTFRYAVKDIIVGVATHRYNRQNRRLEVRAYFIGEHPVFQELEPTRIMFIVLCSQAYQSGSRMELFFENGIPFDIRYLIEQRLGVQISGHEQSLHEDLAKRLYAALSDFSPDMQKRITESEKIDLELVCFNIYRGTWSANQIKSLIQQGIPLRWLFRNHPDPIRHPLAYLNFVNHLRIAAIEEYALHRLADRKMGSSAGKKINRVDSANNEHYFYSDYVLEIRAAKEENEFDKYSSVYLQPNTRFVLLPVLSPSVNTLPIYLERSLDQIAQRALKEHIIVVLPMDFVYLDETLRSHYCTKIKEAKIDLLVIGLTAAQLLEDVERNLRITSAQTDDQEMEGVNVDRFAD